MYISLIYEKMYLRRKIEEYSLPEWTRKIVTLSILLKYIFFFPVCSLLIYSLVVLIDLDIIYYSIMACAFISIDALQFPIKKYLVYFLRKNIPFIDRSRYKRVYVKVYISYFLKTVYKYIMIFSLPIILSDLGIGIKFGFLFITCFLLKIFMNLSSINFYKKYREVNKGFVEKSIIYFLISCTFYFSILSVLFNVVKIDIKLDWFFTLDHTNLILLLLTFFVFITIITELLHFHQVTKKIFEYPHVIDTHNIKTVNNFIKFNFLSKDILLFKRTFNSNISFVKILTILQVTLIVIVPYFVDLYFKGNPSYIVFAMIAVSLFTSNLLCEYLKKILSPDIEFRSFPNNVVQSFNLDQIFLQKTFFYLLLAIYPAVLSFIVLYMYNVSFLYSLISTSLIIIIYINTGMASTLGAILHPKMNPENDYEIGNSSKAIFFENIYSYLISILLSIIFIQDLLIRNANFSLILLTIIITGQVVVLFLAKFYLKNVNIKDVIKNGN